mmetsp:Transcript_60583/g.170709  ORF Transcript_60583/g.170709 Transcript_60583/m.170709 type:complete len:439 (-) Transcript_60583:66-1382(-)
MGRDAGVRQLPWLREPSRRARQEAEGSDYGERGEQQESGHALASGLDHPVAHVVEARLLLERPHELQDAGGEAQEAGQELRAAPYRVQEQLWQNRPRVPEQDDEVRGVEHEPRRDGHDDDDAVGQRALVVLAGIAQAEARNVHEVAAPGEVRARGRRAESRVAPRHDVVDVLAEKAHRRGLLAGVIVGLRLPRLPVLGDNVRGHGAATAVDGAIRAQAVDADTRRHVLPHAVLQPHALRIVLPSPLARAPRLGHVQGGAPLLHRELREGLRAQAVALRHPPRLVVRVTVDAPVGALPGVPALAEARLVADPLVNGEPHAGQPAVPLVLPELLGALAVLGGVHRVVRREALEVAHALVQEHPLGVADRVDLQPSEAVSDHTSKDEGDCAESAGEHHRRADDPLRPGFAAHLQACGAAAVWGRGSNVMRGHSFAGGGASG